MIDADIYGWGVAEGGSLSAEDQRLPAAREDLRESLSAFPEEARPYYRRLVEMATIALDERR
jgi:hypothetical protein